jgi:hypothetical protein
MNMDVADGSRVMSHRAGWLAAIMMMGMIASVQAAVVLNPNGVIPVTLLWNNNDIQVTQDFCVQSTGANNPNASGPVIPYSVTAAAPFTLASGPNQIPSMVRYQDLVTGIITTLAPNVSTADIMTGKAPNCPGGNNGRVIVSYTLANLTSVPPGTYTQSLVLTFSNSHAGGPNNRTATLEFTLVIPDTVRVSQLDDIDLGSFINQNLSASESLCVFRASGLDYAVRVTGSGPGGSYALTNGIDQLPFAATWNDGSGAEPLQAGVLLAGRINAFTGNNHCNNGASNNATLGVQVTAADVNANVATSGNFSGVLTILIEMQ